MGLWLIISRSYISGVALALLFSVPICEAPRRVGSSGDEIFYQIYMDKTIESSAGGSLEEWANGGGGNSSAYFGSGDQGPNVQKGGNLEEFSDEKQKLASDNSPKVKKLSGRYRQRRAKRNKNIMSLQTLPVDGTSVRNQKRSHELEDTPDMHPADKKLKITEEERKLLLAITSSDLSEPLSENDVAIIRRELAAMVRLTLLVQSCKLKFTQTVMASQGCYLLACYDQITFDWVVENVTLTPSWNGRHFKLMKAVIETEPRVYMFIPGAKNLTSAQILDILTFQNDIDTSRWEMFIHESTEKGISLTYCIDDASVQALREIKFRPFFETGKLFVRLREDKGTPKLKLLPLKYSAGLS